tara:strand:- start:12632 stop:14188 length:1557 start_codon:yes stop_codon:yes gene_type:complete
MDINIMEDINENNTISSIGDYVSDLEETVELIRIFSELSLPEREPFIDSISDDEILEITNTVYEISDEYIKENILNFHESTFHKKMEQEITDYIFENLFTAGLCEDNEDENNNETDYNDVFKLVSSIINDYFDLSKEWNLKIPKRVCMTNKNAVDKKQIKTIIDNIRAIPQPEQRTSEWYAFRHDLITASNLGKIFGTEALRNSLIYEKCSPLKFEDDDNGYTYVNTTSPLHWGQKYEPVSVMLYEKHYNTKVDDFGCIQHKDYDFIGASPDGINVDPNSDRYGRMLEIKNIVNRDIDGNPSKQYWIQMQIQLETCNLDLCDFLETRIKEFENSEEFYESTKEKGVILHFVERISIGAPPPTDSPTDENTGYLLAQKYSGKPNYVYMPLDIDLNKESINAWIEETRTKMRRSWSLYEPIYWYLDEMSLVVVERNQPWFKAAIPFIKETWETILHEREHGYDHRAAKKRIPKPPGLEVVQSDEQDSRIIRNLPSTGGICLVKLDHDDLEENIDHENEMP